MIAKNMHKKMSIKETSKGFIFILFILGFMLSSLWFFSGSVQAADLVPDEGLRKVINEKLKETDNSIDIDNHKPSQTDLESLTKLSISPNEIKSLTGLEHAINLEGFELYQNKISDISPLDKLKDLESLTIYGNEVTDISPLEELEKLSFLNLIGNEISDVSPLSGLTNLEGLHLALNEISDVSPLSGLTNLNTLSLYTNEISDVSPLAGLTNLNTLSLFTNEISDISPLSELENLTELYLNKNKIKDLSPLKDLFDNLDKYNFSSQSIILPEIELLVTATTLEIDNPIIDYNGEILDDEIVVDGGLYDENNKTIKWEDLTINDNEKIFTFDDKSDDSSTRFWGTVTQPIKWVAMLPKPIFTEATCEVPEAGVSIPSVGGVNFQIQGTEAAGETITIVAQPGEYVELVATDVWEIDDGFGFYEHTFDELGDCEIETTKIPLPTPEFTEATCEVPEVGVSIPSIEGVNIQVEGTEGAGETITIIAKPGDNIELVATDGWILDDGYGFYEHTFDELGECEEEEPTVPEADSEGDKENGSKITIEDDSDETVLKETDEKKLPKTATSNFNMLVIGLSLVLLGGISFIFIRRRALK